MAQGRSGDDGILVYIIKNREQAEKVRDEVRERRRTAQSISRSDPRKAKIDLAVATALKMIFDKPSGWYRAELQAELRRTIKPQLGYDMMAEIMTAVDEVVTPAKEGDIRLLRNRRLAERTAPK